jgi:hypothetical protein
METYYSVAFPSEGPPLFLVESLQVQGKAKYIWVGETKSGSLTLMGGLKVFASVIEAERTICDLYTNQIKILGFDVEYQIINTRSTADKHRMEPSKPLISVYPTLGAEK